MCIANIFYTIFSLPFLIPRVFIKAAKIARALIPVIITGVATLIEIFSTVNGYLSRIISFVSEKLEQVRLPVSRIMASLSKSMKSIEYELRHRILNSPPIYLRPFIYFFNVSIEFVAELLDFISKIYPHITYIFILHLIWYWPMYPFAMYIEENPLATNDTVNTFFLALKGLYGAITSVFNVFIFVYDLLVPFFWFSVTSAVYLITMLSAHIGVALGLIPNLRSLIYFNPIKHLEMIFSTSIYNSKLDNNLRMNAPNARVNVNVNQGAFNIRKLSETVNTRLWSSVNPHINHEFKRGRELLTTVLSDNPVFANVPTSEVYATSAFAFGVLQVILTTLLTGMEAAFDFVYIIIDGILMIIQAVRVILLQIIPYITKGVCAFGNLGCAINQFVADGIDKFGEDIGVGRLSGGGCSASELQDVPCLCSLEEGGLFRNMPPCQPKVYSCVKARVGADGRTLYKEMLGGVASGLVEDPVQEIACPNVFQKMARMLTVTQCFYSCIVDATNPLLSSDHLNGWYVEVCGNDRYYIGHCYTDGNIVTIDSAHARTLYDKNTDTGKAYFEKLKSLHPDYLFHFDDSSRPAPMPTPPPPPPPLAGLFSKPFKDILIDINNVHMKEVEDDEYMKTSCSSSSSFLTYENIMQQMLCTIRKYIIIHRTTTSMKSRRDTPYNIMNSEQKGRGRRFLKDVFSINSDDFYIKTNANEEEEEEEDTKKGALHYYITPIALLFRDLGNNKMNGLQILESFHENVINAHKDYIYSIDPNAITMVGIGRGLYTKTALQFVNYAMNATIQSMKQADDTYKTHFIGPTDSHEKGIFRRFLLSNSDNMGYAVSLCGYNGYLCPDGVTCAPNGDPRKCTPCQTYDSWCTLRSVPHAINTGFESINIGLLFNNAVECWQDISANPNKNPLRGIADGRILIWDQNPQFYAKDIRYCLGLTPPLPLIPLLVWDYLKYIGDVCGENNPGASVMKCVCPQYTTPEESGEVYVSWLAGIPLAVKARISNCNTALRYRLSSFYGASVISEIWVMLVSFFYGPPETIPSVAYALDWNYNQYNLSPEVNEFCAAIHSASIYFAISFFYYPLTIFLLYGRRLVWIPVRIPLDIFAAITTHVFNFLRDINRSYVMDTYDPTWKKSDKDIEPNQTPLLNKESLNTQVV